MHGIVDQDALVNGQAGCIAQLPARRHADGNTHQVAGQDTPTGRANAADRPIRTQDLSHLGLVVYLHAFVCQAALDDHRFGVVKHIRPVALAAQQVTHLHATGAQPFHQLKGSDTTTHHDCLAVVLGQPQELPGFFKAIQAHHTVQLTTGEAWRDSPSTGGDEQAGVIQVAAILKKHLMVVW